MDRSRLTRRNASTRPKLGRYAPPSVSPMMLRWFLGYAQRYARKNFHSVRVAEERNVLAVVGQPVLLYMNHSSWWDPILAAVVSNQYFPRSMHYAPIDGTALTKYKFFAKLGFFGITKDDVASGRKLLDIGTQVLRQDNSVLWITPQARFSDVRERPLRLGNGLRHLVQRATDCVVLPAAIEYAFWEEKTPEALVRFGAPIEGHDLAEAARTPNAFELRLEECMDALARDSIARDSARFHTILSGSAGIGGVYDLWRRVRATLRGQPFSPEHGVGR